MKIINPKLKQIIKEHSPIADEGYFGKKWNVIVNNKIYNVSFEQKTGKIYLVITNFDGEYEKILLDKIEEYGLFFYEIANDENYIYIFYINFYYEMYFIKFDIYNKTHTIYLIDVLNELDQHSHLSNLCVEDGNVYFVALNKKQCPGYENFMYRYYIHLYAFNGQQWRKIVLEEGDDDRLKFIYNRYVYNYTYDKGGNFLNFTQYNARDYAFSINIPTTPIDKYYVYKFTLNSLQVNYGRPWAPNINLFNYTYINPSWTNNKVYEPKINLYNGSWPHSGYRKWYNEGDLVHFYNMDTNEVYGTRNDYILECIESGYADEYWNPTLVRAKEPGDFVEWGYALFKLYIARGYIIAYKNSPYTTWNYEPFYFEEGLPIAPNDVYQDRYCYYTGGQFRPLHRIINQRYWFGEYITVGSKLFYVIETRGNYFSGLTGGIEDPVQEEDLAELEHGETIDDNEITWKCFDTNYIYEGEKVEFAHIYNPEYTWSKKYFFVNNPLSPTYTKIEFVNDTERIEPELDDDNKFDIHTTLTYDKEYRIALKRDQIYVAQNVYFPYLTSPRIIDTNPDLVNIVCDENNIYINFVIFSNIPKCYDIGEPYDTIILNRNNFNIIKKDRFLPLDSYDEDEETCYYYQIWRKPILVKDKIYFAENDYDTWAEQVRCFKIIDNSLSLEWVKNLPEETTYNDNYYITTDGKYLYFFFQYDANEFILKKVDLDGENGESYLIKCKKLNTNRYWKIFVHNFIIKKKTLIIPVIYYAEDNDYYSILISSDNNFMPFMWYYWWTPECGEEYDTSIKSETYKGKDPERGV